MAKCPFKKRIVTTIEYNISNCNKPGEIINTEEFGECDYYDCKAYIGGMCKIMEGNK